MVGYIERILIHGVAKMGSKPSFHSGWMLLQVEGEGLAKSFTS